MAQAEGHAYGSGSIHVLMMMFQALCRSRSADGSVGRKPEVFSSCRHSAGSSHPFCSFDGLFHLPSPLLVSFRRNSSMEGVVMATAFERFDLDGDGPRLKTDCLEMP